jgi:hypothetical protein
MKLAVLTDTHVGSIHELPGLMLKALADVDLIVHAGDFTETAVLEGLRALREVKAVCGNMDSRTIRMALPRKDLFVAGREEDWDHSWFGYSMGNSRSRAGGV